MLPDENSELRYELLDARKALDRIRKALGVERTIPLTIGGYAELAALVETLMTELASAAQSPAAQGPEGVEHVLEICAAAAAKRSSR